MIRWRWTCPGAMKLTWGNIVPGQQIIMWTRGNACPGTIMTPGKFTVPGSCEQALNVFLYTETFSILVVSLFYDLCKYLAINKYCYLNKEECNLNQSKDVSFVKWVAKNNSWNNGDRHKIHQIFQTNCFVFVVSLVWRTVHGSAMTQIKAHLMKKHCN